MSALSSRLILLGFALVLGLAPGCDRKLNAATDGTLALGQNMFRSGHLTVQAPTELHADLQPHLERWSEVCGGLSLVIQAPGEPVTEGPVLSFDLVQEGPVWTQAFAETWGPGAALDEMEGSIDEIVAIRTYGHREEASFGEATTYPYTQVTATRLDRLRSALPHVRPGWRERRVLLRRGEVLLHHGGTDESARWIVAPEDARFTPDPLKSQAGWTVRADDIEAARVGAYLTKVATMRARLGRWATIEDARDWNLVARNTIPAPHGSVGPNAAAFRPAPQQRLARVDRPTRTVFAFLLEDEVDDAGREVGRSMVLDALGAPSEDWMLDGAAWEAADAHAGVELQAWCARLGALPERPSIEDLLAPSCAWSHHIVGPLRGLLVRIAIEQPGGADSLRAAWSGNAGALAAMRDLGPALEERLATLRERYPELVSVAVEASARRVGAVMTTSSQGTPMGSHLGGLALAYLGHAQANTVALWTESAERVDPDPGAAWLPQHHAGAGEGDVALLIACQQARAHGMQAILMPQLLATPSGLPAGQLVRVFDSMWEQLFDDFTRFTEHHALLAELAGASHLVVGHSLPEMSHVLWTEDRPESAGLAAARAHKRAGWNRALDAAEAAFTGGLMFSAAEPHKVDFVDFWARMEGVATACFPSLSGGGETAPDDEQIRRQIASYLQPALRAAAEYDKPLWILPAGFRSTTTSWAGPGRNGGVSSPQQQARMLKLLDDVLDGLSERDPNLIAGVLVWRWSTHAPGGEDYPGGRRDFSIRGAPAEAVLTDLAE
tara:strand:- start:31263 stop:33605 length:2343 start_codon:yes stop_codon:yes gene_type:complete